MSVGHEQGAMTPQQYLEVLFSRATIADAFGERRSLTDSALAFLKSSLGAGRVEAAFAHDWSQRFVALSSRGLESRGLTPDAEKLPVSSVGDVVITNAADRVTLTGVEFRATQLVVDLHIQLSSAPDLQRILASFGRLTLPCACCYLQLTNAQAETEGLRDLLPVRLTYAPSVDLACADIVATGSLLGTQVVISPSGRIVIHEE